MSDTRECGTCFWLIRTCDEGVGFCEEHEKLVRNDEEACEKYKRYMKQIGGDV